MACQWCCSWLRCFPRVSISFVLVNLLCISAQLFVSRAFLEGLETLQENKHKHVSRERPLAVMCKAFLKPHVKKANVRGTRNVSRDIRFPFYSALDDLQQHQIIIFPFQIADEKCNNLANL